IKIVLKLNQKRIFTTRLRAVTPAYQNTCLPKLCVGKLELWQALWRAGTKSRLVGMKCSIDFQF
ncbi:MAG: hypothetical protein KKH32_02300, partial [Bacteroidetes bacterium]|nr:hypothetical protein [Bacteroidota bacterium]